VKGYPAAIAGVPVGALVGPTVGTTYRHAGTGGKGNTAVWQNLVT